MEETGARKDREAIRRGNLRPRCVLALTQGHSFLSLSIPGAARSVIAAGRETRPLRTLLVIDERCSSPIAKRFIGATLSVRPAITCPGFSRQPSFWYSRQRIPLVLDFPLVRKKNVNFVLASFFFFLSILATLGEYYRSRGHFVFFLFLFFSFFFVYSSNEQSCSPELLSESRFWTSRFQPGVFHVMNVTH